jgi:tripartite-type tricarboxylate transporter receptor subunit TctC
MRFLRIRRNAIVAGAACALSLTLPALAQTFPSKPIRLVVPFEADQWYGLVAPAGTPANVVSLLNEHVNRALASDEVRSRLAAEGAEATPASPSAFGQLIAKEIPRWERVVKSARITVD